MEGVQHFFASTATLNEGKGLATVRKWVILRCHQHDNTHWKEINDARNEEANER